MNIGPGLGSGLSQSLQFDQRTNDLYRRQEYEARVRNEAISRATMQAKDAEFQHAANPYDEAIIKDFAKKTASEIGRYRQENPDYAWNPDKLAYINSKRDEIRYHPSVMRSIQVANAEKELEADLVEAAKNPQQWDYEELQNRQQSLNNYYKYGHPEGQAGIEKDGGPQPFTYVRPQMLIDVPEGMKKVGSGITNFKVVKPKDGNPGEYYTEPDANELDTMTNAFISQNQRSVLLNARKLGITDARQLQDYVREGIKAGFKKEYHIGNADAEWQHRMAMANYNQRERLAGAKKSAGSGYSPFDFVTDPRNKAGRDNTDDIRKLIGDKPPITVQGISGARQDLSGMEWLPNGKYLNKGGLTWFLGNVEVPLAVAAQKGIINKYDEDDEKEPETTSARITADYLGQAAFTTKYNKDGKPYKVVNVSYHIPVNPNDQNLRQKWNAFKDVDKLVAPSSDPFTNQAPKGASVNDKGEVFDIEGNLIGYAQ